MDTCAACGSENPAGSRFCNSCGASLDARAHGREERKVVTVLFADLVGFTARAERLDPEDVRAIQRPYFAQLRRELERYGGTVEKFIGDAVMAVFGAPAAHEDDPERAVRAALAIRDSIADTDLQVRIAVATGEALVALDARASEGESIVAGDVVNTASRLQSAAPSNGILVVEATYRATAQAIEYREAGSVTAKGKTAAIAAWEAVAPRARLGVDVQQHGPTRLIGRDRELDLLAGALARARAERETQLVTLIGVPGIGKSRLVFELLQHVHDDPELIFWRQGRCLPYGDGVAFWALGEIVKAQLGVLDTDDVEAVEGKLATALEGVDDSDWIGPHLRTLLGLAGAAGDTTDAFAAWRRYLESLAERSPLVLVFEDLHWADGALLDFVEHLTDWARGVPILVICTARPELHERRPTWGGGKLNALTLALSPLNEAETEQLITALVERTFLGEETRAAVVARAGGNPLYAEQFVRMLGEGDPRDLPESVQGIIAARLDALPADEKALLQDAAVVGKVFWPSALGHPEAEFLLHGLERKEFVRRERNSTVAGETEYAFRHVLVRDVAYGQIPRAERSEKHRRAGEWIESLSNRGDDTIEMLAHHYGTALELVRAAGSDDSDLVDKVRFASRDAGRRAWRLGAFAASASYFHRALDLWPDDDERPLLLFRALRAQAVAAGTLAGAERAMLEESRDRLRALGDLEHAAEAQIVLAEETKFTGSRDESRRLLEEALAWLQDRGPSLAKGRVLRALASHAMLANDRARAIEAARAAAEIIAASGGDEGEAAASHGLAVYLAYAISGDPREWSELEGVVETLVRTRSRQLASALSSMGSIAMDHIGDVRTGRAYHVRSIDEATRLGNPLMAHHAALQIAGADYWLGSWDAARAALDDFIVTDAPDMQYGLSFAHMTRSRIEAARGDLDGALADMVQSLERAFRFEDAQLVLPALMWRSRLTGEGLDEALDAWRREPWTDAPYGLPDLAAALVAAGRADEFVRLAEVKESPSRWLRAATLIARGEVAAAAEVFQEIGSLPDVAWCRAQAGDTKAADAFYRSVGAEVSIPAR